jgi:hypothetical protein
VSHDENEPVSKSPLVSIWLTQTFEGEGVAGTVESVGLEELVVRTSDNDVPDETEVLLGDGNADVSGEVVLETTDVLPTVVEDEIGELVCTELATAELGEDVA